MKDIRYETTEEQRMIVGIQKAFGATANGVIGNQTLSDIAKRHCPEVFPLSLKIYGMSAIIAKNIIPFDPDTSIRGFNNTVSGSYTYPTGDKPCTIMVRDGKTICGYSAHSHLGKPDSVIYECFDGTIGWCRALYDGDIPNREKVKWAIGGAGLGIHYDPSAEGYYSFTLNGKRYDFSDVWRDTNHIIFGVKDGWKYGVYAKNMNASEMNVFCALMQFEHALKLDGGHVPAINTSDSALDNTPDVNLDLKQGYAIQFVR